VGAQRERGQEGLQCVCGRMCVRARTRACACVIAVWACSSQLRRLLCVIRSVRFSRSVARGIASCAHSQRRDPSNPQPSPQSSKQTNENKRETTVRAAAPLVRRPRLTHRPGCHRLIGEGFYGCRVWAIYRSPVAAVAGWFGWAHPGHICTGTGALPWHICAGTGLTPATSAPAPGSPLGAGGALGEDGLQDLGLLLQSQPRAGAAPPRSHAQPQRRRTSPPVQLESKRTSWHAIMHVHDEDTNRSSDSEDTSRTTLPCAGLAGQRHCGRCRCTLTAFGRRPSTTASTRCWRYSTRRRARRSNRR
jgi:hypothetical protein